MQKTDSERFWSRVDRAGKGCWIWGGRRYRDGYGEFSARRDGIVRRVAAHRWSWEEANGRLVPSGMYICHRCDNPACVRPDHLFLGTPQDNELDKRAKGRAHSTAGRENGNAVLAEADVLEMRRLAAEGVSCAELARRWGLHHKTVGRAVHGDSWADLPLAMARAARIPEGKPIRHGDPRKPAIVAALRRRTGATKITCIREIDRDLFRATCFGWRVGNHFPRLGDFVVTASEAGLVDEPKVQGG